MVLFSNLYFHVFFGRAIITEACLPVGSILWQFIFLLIKSLRYLIWDFVPDKTKNYFYDDQRKSKDKEIIEVDYKDLDDK